MAVALSLLVTAITPIVLDATGGPAAADVRTSRAISFQGCSPATRRSTSTRLVGLSGGTVAASYGRGACVWTHPVTGAGDWTQASTASFEDRSTKEFTYGDGTVLTETGRDVTRLVLHRGVARGQPGLSMGSGRATLSHGGVYVLRTSR